jgi:hypothetical protein
MAGGGKRSGRITWIQIITGMAMPQYEDSSSLLWDSQSKGYPDNLLFCCTNTAQSPGKSIGQVGGNKRRDPAWPLAAKHRIGG